MAINFNNNINKRPIETYADWASFLTKLTPNEFTLLATIVGITMSQGLSIVEQNSIGNFFILVGQIAVTYNGQAITVNTINDSLKQDKTI